MEPTTLFLVSPFISKQMKMSNVPRIKKDSSGTRHGSPKLSYYCNFGDLNVKYKSDLDSDDLLIYAEWGVFW